MKAIRVSLIACMGLVLATSMNLAQTQTPGGATNQGTATTTQGTDQGSTGGPTTPGITGFPSRPVDGTYAIVAFERNGVPNANVVNRSVTIRNNIMIINTGDPNQPAKTFQLRFLPNNHIQLVELDPRTINTTGITAGPNGIVIGGVGTPANTGTSTNGIPGTTSTGQGTGSTPPFNPRPDLGGTPPAGAGTGAGGSVPGAIRTPPFNPRPDLGGTPPAGGAAAGARGTGLVRTPPFNPRPDLGGTPPSGGTSGGTSGASGSTPPFNPRPDLGGTPPSGGTSGANVPGSIQTPPFNPRPDLGGTPPSTGTGANQTGTNPNTGSRGVVMNPGTGAGTVVDPNVPNNHLGIEQGVYVLSSQFFAISVNGRISGPTDPVIQGGVTSRTGPQGRVTPGPGTITGGARSTAGTSGATTTTGDPRGTAGSGTASPAGDPRGTVNPGTPTGDPRGTVNPGTSGTGNSGTGTTGTGTTGAPVDNGIPGTGTTIGTDPGINPGFMPQGGMTVLILRRIG